MQVASLEAREHLFSEICLGTNTDDFLLCQNTDLPLMKEKMRKANCREGGSVTSDTCDVLYALQTEDETVSMSVTDRTREKQSEKKER